MRGALYPCAVRRSEAADVCVWERILSFAPLTCKQRSEAEEDRTTTAEYKQ